MITVEQLYDVCGSISVYQFTATDGEIRDPLLQAVLTLQKEIEKLNSISVNDLNNFLKEV